MYCFLSIFSLSVKVFLYIEFWSKSKKKKTKKDSIYNIRPSSHLLLLDCESLFGLPCCCCCFCFTFFLPIYTTTTTPSHLARLIWSFYIRKKEIKKEAAPKIELLYIYYCYFKVLYNFFWMNFKCVGVFSRCCCSYLKFEYYYYFCFVFFFRFTQWF